MLWCNKTKEVDKRFSCDVKTRGTVSSIIVLTLNQSTVASFALS